jgi:hypothetical protein
MRCITYQFTIMHRLAGDLLINKLTGLNLSGKRADSESGKRGQLSLYQVLMLTGKCLHPLSCRLG